MKKVLLPFLLFLAHCTLTYGQVYTNPTTGQVALGTSTFVNKAIVSAGATHNYTYPYNFSFGLLSHAIDGTYSVGLKGLSSASSSIAHAIGVQGLADGGQSGFLYGVVGGLSSQTSNGAGIFGTLVNHFGYNVYGRYAGYFDGSVYLNGNTTSLQLVMPSDNRLQENVTRLGKNNLESDALERLLCMNVIKYNLVKPKYDTNDEDSTVVFPDENEASYLKRSHYGLSAQELQTIYPDLVVEGQDGFLCVNYIELVPILIQSIQELKQELDDLRNGTGVTRGTTDCSRSVISQNILYQTCQNSINEKITIRFKVAENSQNASINIYDLRGKMLKEYPVSSGNGSISVSGYELGEGMFLYSLVVNGQEIDTKKIIISK